ncbi:MAG: fibronectin type III domain-containing protein, partial [Bacteroidota bacterium]
MKNYIYITIVILFATRQQTIAQQGQAKLLSTITSPAGNYIYLLGPDVLSGPDSLIMKRTDRFIIERVDYDSVKNSAKSESSMREVGTAKTVSSIKELRSFISASDIEDMKSNFKLKTDQDLVDFFQSRYGAGRYSLYYKAIEVRMAMGHVFFDKDVQPGETVLYRITRVDKDKSKQLWGNAIVQSKVGNYTLQYLKPIEGARELSDSSITLTWKLYVNENQVAKMPRPKSKFVADKEGRVFRVPFPLSELRGKVNILKDGAFVEDAKLLPVLNLAGDTATYTYFGKTTSDEAVSVYMNLEDEVYNQGRSSDTATVFSVTNRTIPLIFGIKVNPIVDGIHLTWKQLPAKPYIRGIEIVRLNSQNKLDSIGVLPVTDTTYNDYATAIGQHYVYQVKAVYLPGLNVEQKKPAEGAGQMTIFSKPSTPYNLAATGESKNVRLNWEVNDQPAFFGFYIYRGTSPKHMTLIAGPVKTKTFLDSAQSLSGRSRYYYAVVNQNLRQDTSTYSNVVDIRPSRKINITPPADVHFYYVNGKLDIRWKDIRESDNVIESYVLQKKKKTDASYIELKLQPNSVAYADSLIESGITYQYRVAAVADNGEISEFS